MTKAKNNCCTLYSVLCSDTTHHSGLRSLGIHKKLYNNKKSNLYRRTRLRYERYRHHHHHHHHHRHHTAVATRALNKTTGARFRYPLFSLSCDQAFFRQQHACSDRKKNCCLISAPCCVTHLELVRKAVRTARLADSDN